MRNLNRREDRRAIAEYCAQLCHELRDIAANNNFKFLAYVLEIARMEAIQKSKGKNIGDFDDV